MGICGRSKPVVGAILGQVQKGEGGCLLVDRADLQGIKRLRLLVQGDTLKPSDFEGLEQVDEVEISGASVKITRGLFRALTGLQELEIQNAWVEFEEGAFESNFSLKSLQLKFGALTGINRGILGRAKTLERVEFSLTSGENPGRGFFEGLQSLRYLSVFCDSLDENFFNDIRGLRGLESLAILGSRINVIPPRAFAGIPLQRLEISAPLSERADWRFLDDLTSLSGLNVRITAIGLPPGTFNVLPSLKTLSLRGKDLRLEGGLFEGLVLDHLTIEDVDMTYLPSEPFRGLSTSRLTVLAPKLETIPDGFASEALRIGAFSTLDEAPLTKTKPSAFTHLGTLDLPPKFNLEREDTWGL